MSIVKRKFTEGINSILNTGNRVARMNLQPLLKGFSFLSLNQAVGIGTALILALAYAHLLPKEIYGTYKYILALLGMLTVFSLPGMDSAAQKWIAAGKEGVFWPTFRKRVEWSGVSVLLGLGIGFYYLVHGNQVLAYSFLIVAPLLLVLEPFSHFNALLIGRQQYKRFSYYSAALQLATAFVILLTILLTQNIVIIIASYFLSFVLARGVVLWLVVIRDPPTGEHEDEVIRYGTHFSIINIIGVGAGQLDAILLFHFLGPVALAIYSFGQAASGQARKVFKVVTSVMAFPKFAALDVQRLKTELPHKILIAHLITIPLALVLVIIIPPFYHLLFPTYVESIPYAQVMAGLLAFSPIRMISTAINAKGSIRDIYTMNLTASLLQIAFLAILVPLYGIWGAVFASPIQSFLSNIVFIRIFRSL
jgi:O-antigen/teichoic acid export membrane protein